MLPASVMESLSEGYDKLWRQFIQPQRAAYSLEDLGPELEVEGDLCFVREDFRLPLDRTRSLAASFFYPVSTLEAMGSRAAKVQVRGSADVRGLPCLVYCHSHGSCRTEGRFLREFCFRHRYALLLFDFLGHGHSDGEFSSLGLFEKRQLEAVVDYARSVFNVGPIALWGRSMGAVASLLFAERNAFLVSAMVLDTPFTSLVKMCQDVAGEHYSIPKLLVGLGIGVINGSIKARLHMDLFEALVPLDAAKRCSVLAAEQTHVMFVSGEKDGLVPPKRISQYVSFYGSGLPEALRTHEKQMVASKKAHSEEREPQVLEGCLDFLRRHLEAEKQAVTACYRRLQDMRRYRRLRPVRLDFLKAPAAQKPQQPQQPQASFSRPERRPVATHRRRDSEAPAELDTPQLQSTQSSEDARLPSKYKSAAQLSRGYLRRPPTDSSSAGASDKPQAGRPLRSRIFEDEAADPRAPGPQTTGRSPFREFEQAQLASRPAGPARPALFDCAAPLRRPTLSLQPPPRAPPAGALPGAPTERRESRREELQTKFDDEDLSLLLDSQYLLLQTQTPGAESLEDSLLQDLRTLDGLLRRPAGGAN